MMSLHQIPELEIDNPDIKVSKRIDYSDCCYINVFDNSSICYRDFFEKYMIKNLPCIIKNISSSWECDKKWVIDDKVNYNHFITNYGNLQAPVADCQTESYNSHCTSNMKISEYMNYLSSDEKDQILYLKDWHLRKQQPNDNFYEVPSIFSSDWLNEYCLDTQDDDYMFVYIGPKYSWTPLHADVYCSYSWSVNITGKKIWILFPPGEERKLQDSFGNLPILFDPGKHEGIKHFDIIQEAGDAIFVPSGWYHQVQNVLDTISINHNWINACNIEYVWEALQKNIISVEKEMRDLSDTEEFASHCQLILKSLFGMDFQMFIDFLSYIGKKRLSQLQSSNFKGFGNCNYGIKHMKFDVTVIMELMGKIVNHPLFINKDVLPLDTKNKFIILKKSIEQQLLDSLILPNITM